MHSDSQKYLWITISFALIFVPALVGTVYYFSPKSVCDEVFKKYTLAMSAEIVTELFYVEDISCLPNHVLKRLFYKFIEGPYLEYAVDFVEAVCLKFNINVTSNHWNSTFCKFTEINCSTLMHKSNNFEDLTQKIRDLSCYFAQHGHTELKLMEKMKYYRFPPLTTFGSINFVASNNDTRLFILSNNSFATKPNDENLTAVVLHHKVVLEENFRFQSTYTTADLIQFKFDLFAFFEAILKNSKLLVQKKVLNFIQFQKKFKKNENFQLRDVSEYPYEKWNALPAFKDGFLMVWESNKIQKVNLQIPSDSPNLKKPFFKPRLQKFIRTKFQLHYVFSQIESDLKLYFDCFSNETIEQDMEWFLKILNAKYEPGIDYFALVMSDFLTDCPVMCFFDSKLLCK